ncbi:hypothetical protein WMY93_030181 [Mugilogobius chulae]|uniref:Insulin-induced gene protein n=1 Tax=Mugilogobius chulae TaxID=88201 RepID=A0AAW0MX50_9GOBI
MSPMIAESLFPLPYCLHSCASGVCPEPKRRSSWASRHIIRRAVIGQRYSPDSAVIVFCRGSARVGEGEFLFVEERKRRHLKNKYQMPRLEDHCSCTSKHLSGAKWFVYKAEEMMSIITSMLSQAYGSLHDVRTANLIRRGLVLFTVGAILALEVMTTLFSSAWWIPPCCGTGAAVVGLLYPCLDKHLGEPHKFKREWASVMRCIAVFVGINHASVVSFTMPHVYKNNVLHKVALYCFTHIHVLVIA